MSHINILYYYDKRLHFLKSNYNELHQATYKHIYKQPGNLYHTAPRNIKNIKLDSINTKSIGMLFIQKQLLR